MDKHRDAILERHISDRDQDVNDTESHDRMISGGGKENACRLRVDYVSIKPKNKGQNHNTRLQNPCSKPFNNVSAVQSDSSLTPGTPQ